MKQESVNTFSDGLNFDLNPLTTPKTMLIDNVNGTFITFNGDELSLQNDAGNTTIKYNASKTEIPDWQDVALSPGFAPLGIKEYGGVLYIVSGKDFDRNLTNIVLGNEYTVNEVILYNGVYYKCVKDHKLLDLLDITGGILWKRLGLADSERSIRELYNEIEFGSYPSPESSAYETLPGKTLRITESFLYVPFLLNSYTFKAGRFSTFLSSTISGSVRSTSNPSGWFYQIKLYLQLDNGMVDLTEDIWEKFTATSSAYNHWLLDPNFKYYCDSMFKGQLVLQVELNEPTFSLKSVEVEPGSNDSEINVIIETVGTVSGEVKFYKSSTGDVISPKSINGNTYTFIRTNETITYEIVPSLSDFESYPDVFKNKYTFTGSIDLYTIEYDISFNFLDTVCDEGIKKINVLEIINSLGPVTNGWQTAAEGSPSWILIKEGYNYIHENLHIKIGTFTIGEDNTAVILLDQGFNNRNIIINQGLKTIISYPSQECNNLEVRFDFSVPLSMTSPSLVSDGNLFVYQEGDMLPLQYTSVDFGKTFQVFAKAGKSMFIQLTGGSFGLNIIQIPSGALQSETIHHFGLVLEFEGLTWNTGFTKYVTFRTTPLPVKYKAILDYIVGNSTVQKFAHYTTAQPWQVSNANHFSLVVDGEWCYLEVELEWTDGDFFAVPRTRAVPYYVDISPADLTLVAADAENLTDIGSYTRFTTPFAPHSLFMKKTSTLFLHPITSTRTTSSRVLDGRTYTTR